jgi:hypothetical protein
MCEMNISVELSKLEVFWNEMFKNILDLKTKVGIYDIKKNEMFRIKGSMRLFLPRTPYFTFM